MEKRKSCQTKGGRQPSSPSPDDDSTYPELVLEGYSPHLDTDPGPRKSRNYLEKDPETRLSLHEARDCGIPYFHPCHIPHIETLILTDVPSHVPVDSPITSSLIRFIVACSDESLLASLKAKADYSLPPGRAGLRLNSNMLEHSLAFDVLSWKSVLRRKEASSEA